jgi:hypothetical protein
MIQRSLVSEKSARVTAITRRRRARWVRGSGEWRVTLDGLAMEIGTPRRTYTVEPVEDPVPRELPEESPERERPAEGPGEPEQVPAPTH